MISKISVFIFFFNFLCLFWTIFCFFRCSRFREKLQRTKSTPLQFWIESSLQSVNFNPDEVWLNDNGIEICLTCTGYVFKLMINFSTAVLFIIWRLLYIKKYLSSWTSQCIAIFTCSYYFPTGIRRANKRLCWALI